MTREKRGGASLFFVAVGVDNVDIVRLLIDAGVDISVRDKNVGIALHRATECLSKNVMSFLLELDLDINAKSPEGQTLLQIAIECNGKEIAEILRKYGAKV